MDSKSLNTGEWCGGERNFREQMGKWWQNRAVVFLTHGPSGGEREEDVTVGIHGKGRIQGNIKGGSTKDQQMNTRVILFKDSKNAKYIDR